MRKTAVIVVLILLFAANVHGDEVDQGLAGTASEQVMSSTRQVIGIGIESGNVIGLTQSMIQHNFKDEQILDAHGVLLTAAKKGLPLQAVVAKASEGIAKQVPPATIVSAMQTVASRYEASFAMAAQLANQMGQKNQLGQIVAESMAAGLTDEDATGIVHAVQQRGEEPVKSDSAYALALEAFETARTAVRLGVSSTVTAGLVSQALASGLSPVALQGMQKALTTQSRSTSPEALAKSYSAAMAQGLGFQGKGAVSGSPHGASGTSSGTGGTGASGGSGGSGGGGSGGGSGGSGSGGGSGGDGSGGGSGGGGSGGGSGGSGGR